MHDTPLTDKNFISYCIKNYDNPNCLSVKDFYDDINHRRYIKKHLNKYMNGEDLKERLILNHMIMMNNAFGCPATAKILFYKLEKNLYPTMKTFLLYLGYMPEKLALEDGMLYNDDVGLDQEIVKRLREI